MELCCTFGAEVFSKCGFVFQWNYFQRQGAYWSLRLFLWQKPHCSFKKCRGIRPIAKGNILRRLASKTAMPSTYYRTTKRTFGLINFGLESNLEEKLPAKPQGKSFLNQSKKKTNWSWRLILLMPIIAWDVIPYWKKSRSTLLSITAPNDNANQDPVKCVSPPPPEFGRSVQPIQTKGKYIAICVLN